jgi:hypothetical protein
VNVLNFGEWKAVVPTDASTEVDFLFHTDNKVREREAVLHTANRNYLRDSTAEGQPAPAGRGSHMV